MAFITKSNFNSIFYELEFVMKDDTNLNFSLYKKEFYFLSKIEQATLANQREVLKSPENIIKIYKKLKRVDTFTYVFEGLTPAYHKDKLCPNLGSKFINFQIPLPIREKGESEVLRFRSWFKENGHYLETKPDLFIAKLEIAFDVKINPEAIEIENSGIKEIENLNLNQLEERINDYLRAASKFYNDNPDKQQIIRRFQKLTFLYKRKDAITGNDTNLSDRELKSFLKEYDIKFKKPVMDLLLQYYMVQYNPELDFDGKLLEQLGFKPCIQCHNQT